MAGCTTGAMAVAFAQPTDVVKVRFQAEVRMADGVRRYNGTMDAYRTIARDEGVRGLWKGELAIFQLSCSPVGKAEIQLGHFSHVYFLFQVACLTSHAMLL